MERSLVMVALAGAFSFLNQGYAAEAVTAPAGMPKAMEMLVKVQIDSNGSIKSVKHDDQLSPAADSLLRSTLSGWITRSSIHESKKKSSSRYYKVRLVALPRQDGTYDTQFVYLWSGSTNPNASWGHSSDGYGAFDTSSRVFDPTYVAPRGGDGSAPE